MFDARSLFGTLSNSHVGNHGGWIYTPERKTNTQNNLEKHLIPQKETFSKNIKKHNFFDVFNNKGISKLSLEAQDVHYDSPTGFHITETKDPKSKHKVFKFFNTPKPSQFDTKAPNKKNQKVTPFCRPPSPASQGSK